MSCNHVFCTHIKIYSNLVYLVVAQLSSTTAITENLVDFCYGLKLDNHLSVMSTVSVLLNAIVLLTVFKRNLGFF